MDIKVMDDNQDKENLDIKCQERTCEICVKNKANYICPRCNKYYCSIVCYRDLEKHLKCSESFYQEQVITELKQMNIEGDKESKLRMMEYLKQDLEEKENDEQELYQSKEPSLLEEKIDDQKLLNYYKNQIEKWKPWWRDEKFKQPLIEEINKEINKKSDHCYNPALLKNSEKIDVSKANPSVYTDILQIIYNYTIISYIYQLDELEYDKNLLPEICFNFLEVNKLTEKIHEKDLVKKLDGSINLLIQEEGYFLGSYLSDKRFLVGLLNELVYIVENQNLISNIISCVYTFLALYLKNSSNVEKKPELKEEVEQEKPLNVFHLNKASSKIISDASNPKKSRVQIITSNKSIKLENKKHIHVKQPEFSKQELKIFLKKLEYHFKWFISTGVDSQINNQTITNLNSLREKLSNEIEHFQNDKKLIDKNINHLRNYSNQKISIISEN